MPKTNFLTGNNHQNTQKKLWEIFKKIHLKKFFATFTSSTILDPTILKSVQICFAYTKSGKFHPSRKANDKRLRNCVGITCLWE